MTSQEYAELAEELREEAALCSDPRNELMNDSAKAIETLMRDRDKSDQVVKELIIAMAQAHMGIQDKPDGGYQLRNVRYEEEKRRHDELRSRVVALLEQCAHCVLGASLKGVDTSRAMRILDEMTADLEDYIKESGT